MIEIDQFDEFDEVDEEVQVPIRFEVKISATGEVRDKDGNLLSSQPYEYTAIMTEEEVEAFLGQEE